MSHVFTPELILEEPGKLAPTWLSGVLQGLLAASLPQQWYAYTSPTNSCGSSINVLKDSWQRRVVPAVCWQDTLTITS